MRKLLLAIAFLAPVLVTSFNQQLRALRLSTDLGNNRIDGISNELRELGQDTPSPGLEHPPRGFEPKESIVHKLRRELRQKDKLYNQLLDEMENIEHRQLGMADLKAVLESTFSELRHQNVMLRHKKDVPKQQEEILKDFLNTIKRLEDNLVESNAFALAWETAEVELWREKREHEKGQEQHESIRWLLWKTIKLSGKRVRRAMTRLLRIK